MFREINYGFTTEDTKKHREIRHGTTRIYTDLLLTTKDYNYLYVFFLRVSSSLCGAKVRRRSP